jgi:pantothenate kinase
LFEAETRDLKVTTKNFIPYKWNNLPVSYRPGTSDRGLVYNILIQKRKKAEYYIPSSLNPEVILDIGANIGITAIWMSRKFPTAKIYCFESTQNNFDILQKNIKAYENITALNFGLGSKTDTVDIYANEDITNQGGFSLYQLGNDEDNFGTENRATLRLK